MPGEEIAPPQTTDVMDLPSPPHVRDLSLARAATETERIVRVVTPDVDEAVEFVAGDALIVGTAGVAVAVARAGDQAGRRLVAEDAVWAWIVRAWIVRAWIVRAVAGKDGSCRRGHCCQDIVSDRLISGDRFKRERERYSLPLLYFMIMDWLL